jgi:D-glycero-D-manno-heptose 1,7-bisphosphate phosphatase
MKLIVLERDGVLCAPVEEPTGGVAAWQALPGALEAAARLHHAGYRVALALELSGLGRGLFDMGSVQAMHAQILGRLAALGGRIDAIFFCPHAPEDDCDCAFPSGGLFRDLVERYALEPEDVNVVSSTERHAQAAAAAGLRVHGVWRADGAAPIDATCFDSLEAVVNHLLAATGR